jgi:flagellar basal-body rod protein FlgB
MDSTMQMLNKMMSVCEMRQRVLASNVANANTPGYVRRDVTFQQALAEAVRSDDVEKIASVQAQVATDPTRPVGPNGNNVSLQSEMGAMAENGLLYGVAARAIGGKFALLHRAIQSK